MIVLPMLQNLTKKSAELISYNNQTSTCCTKVSYSFYQNASNVYEMMCRFTFHLQHHKLNAQTKENLFDRVQQQQPLILIHISHIIPKRCLKIGKSMKSFEWVRSTRVLFGVFSMCVKKNEAHLNIESRITYSNCFLC